MEVFGLNEQHCDECGKMIFPKGDWAYKRTIWANNHKNAKIVYYCSWSCYKKGKAKEKPTTTRVHFKRGRGEN